jgi:hypothetical protein
MLDSWETCMILIMSTSGSNCTQGKTWFLQAYFVMEGTMQEMKHSHVYTNNSVHHSEVTS